MTAAPAVLPLNRTRFQGVAQSVAYNWPRYIAAGTAVCGIAAFLVVFRVPAFGAVLGWALAGVLAWWTLASLAAAHWVYDRAGLYELTWLGAALDKNPARWINVNAGLDEFSFSLQERFGCEPQSVLDIYDPAQMPEPSIARARGRYPAHPRMTAAHHASLPIPDRSCEAIFILFSAHELRAAEARLSFFREVRRALAPGGAAVVIEHLRDLPNFLAFGPGFWHFISRRAWLRAFSGAGLRLEHENRITPFVRVFVLRSPA